MKERKKERKKERLSNYGALRRDVSELADQQECTNNSSARTQDAVKRTCQKRWTIGTDEECERE